MCNNEKLYKQNNIQLALGMLLLLVIVIVGGAIARYTVQTNPEPAQVGAGNFYFLSNYLSEEGSSHSQVCDDLNSAVIDLELYNYQDKMNVSGTSIEYVVNYKLRSSSEYTQAATGSLSVNADGSGTTNKISLSVKNLNPVGDSVIVDVEVTSSKPYIKTLVGSFTIEKITEGNQIAVSDQAGSNVAQVTVTIGSEGGNVALTAPEGYFPDPTNYLDGEQIISGRTISFTAQADGEYSFRFLKTNPDIVNGDFTLK